MEASELRFDRARQLLAEAKKRAPNGKAPNPIETSIQKLEAGTHDPALSSNNALTRAEARFRVSRLSGRRPDTLQAAERLLQEPRATRPLRREAAEYYIRFGSPAALAHVARTPEAADIFAAPSSAPPPRCDSKKPTNCSKRGRIWASARPKTPRHPLA